MSARLEKTFKAALVRKLNRLPRSDFEPSPPGSNTGKPDITGCLNGRYVGIETKRLGKNAERHQRYKHKRLRAAGALVYVVRTWEEWEPVEKEIRRECKVF